MYKFHNFVLLISEIIYKRDYLVKSTFPRIFMLELSIKKPNLPQYSDFPFIPQYLKIISML